MKNYWLERLSPPNSNAGFPADDELALQQLAGSGCDLDFYYNNQFVQNEVLDPIFPLEKRDNLSLHHERILDRSMTGTIYLKGKAIQTFVHHNGGNFVFQDIYKSKVKVTSIRLNLHTGEISFVWNDKPGDHSFVLSYEYSIECGFDPNQ